MSDSIVFGENISKVHELSKFEKTGLIGIVKSWQTDLDGNVIPGTLKEERNTIQAGLKKYLASCIGAGIIDKKLDNLFDQDYGAGGDAMSAAIDGMDGIAYYDEAEQFITQTFYTELNAGGTGNETYIEFYGYINGAVNLNGKLVLGHNITYGVDSTAFETDFAEYAIEENVAADRKYHFYWKITVG